MSVRIRVSVNVGDRVRVRTIKKNTSPDPYPDSDPHPDSDSDHHVCTIFETKIKLVRAGRFLRRFVEIFKIGVFERLLD